MQYLFFDIECCDGKHICEFGYVITDEEFKILEQNDITINPDKPFNLTDRPGRVDLKLFFSEETYYSSPLFSVYYDKIKTLIEAPNQIVVGHAVNNDAEYLRTACKRYGLRPINFDFVDSQILYREFSNDKKRVSLEKAEEIFNLDKPNYLHKADEDAKLTMQLVEKICVLLDINLQVLMTLCPTACGKSYYHEIMYKGDSLEERLGVLAKNESLLSNKKKQKCVNEFLKIVEPTERIKNSKLNGKKICFSANFEKCNAKQTIILIQLLANHECRYNAKVSENDFYVASTDELNDAECKTNSRYYFATHSDSGCGVEVLTMEDLCVLLGITEDELLVMDMPKVPKKQNHDKKPKKTVNHIEGSATTSLGDILKSKGIGLQCDVKARY